MLRGLGIIFVLLASPIPRVAELPPEVQADKYLEQAKRLMENKDYTAALDTMDAIADLKRKQEFELPKEFYFRYAQMALPAGKVETAMKSVKKYLSTWS